MRQKEVMGQSIRTSKSARPGTITYVPIDKSEFRSTVSSDKKKNKIMKIVVMLIVMILVMSCCIYAGVSYYYSYHFFLGTTINGIDSSNKTAYEVEQEIAGKKDNYVIQVSARMQEPQTITGKDIDYQYVSSGEILQLLKTQKPWEWIRVFFETKNYMVQEETVFSREKLEEQVSSLNCAKKENQIAPENAYVSFSNSEFSASVYSFHAFLRSIFIFLSIYNIRRFSYGTFSDVFFFVCRPPMFPSIIQDGIKRALGTVPDVLPAYQTSGQIWKIR